VPAFRPIYETILELLDRKALVILLVGAGGSVCPLEDLPYQGVVGLLDFRARATWTLRPGPR
jgi:hypothetical protein